MEGELRKRYPKVENAVVCSNAAFVTPLPAVAQRPNRSGLVLGHLGNLTFEKGLEEVLELLRTLRGTGLPVTLRLAGEPMSPDVAATVRAAQRELGSALVVEGPATGAEKDRFFSSIDLFVLPSRYVHEAEPLVVLEALAAGTPIVAIGRGCLADGFSGAGRITDTSEDFVRIAAQYCRSLAEDGRGLDDQRRAVSAGFRRRRGAAEKALSDLVAVITAERERE